MGIAQRVCLFLSLVALFLICRLINTLESKTEEIRIEDTGSDGKTDTDALPNTSKGDDVVKGGSIIPNRVFVGGIAASATDWDLRSKFSSYGNIKAVKIIRDHLGISRGYGFVTFNTEEEARAILEKTEITFKGRKLNIAPAIKKQNYRSDPQYYSARYEVENYPGSFIEEQHAMRKDDRGYAELSEYPGFVTGEAPYPIDNSTVCMDNGLGFSASNLQCNIGNPQMNFLPYPTLVYIPQHSHQFPGTNIAYPINGNIPELMQVLPAPLCYLNNEPK